MVPTIKKCFEASTTQVPLFALFASLTFRASDALAANNAKGGTSHTEAKYGEPLGQPDTNGLLARSRPIVVSGPCPQTTRVSSGRV